MPTPKPPYPAEFRQQMVELVHAGILHVGPHRGARALASQKSLPKVVEEGVSVWWAAGKPKTVAIVACMRKLLSILNAMPRD